MLRNEYACIIMGAFQRIFGAFFFLENKFVSQAKPILYIFHNKHTPFELTKITQKQQVKNITVLSQ